ncbi:MAG: hypothetical protein ABII07_00440 [Patescibacteria group bacterium]|nr:hypothetical protein [Patescibacteria group bacterium]
MDYTNKHFKGQQRNEQLVYFTRKHWMTLIGVLTYFGLTTAAVAGLLFFVFTADGSTKEFLDDAKWGIMAVMIAATMWFHYLFIRFTNYFLDIVIITNFRIIRLEKTLYLKNNRDVVDLHEIQDIKKIQHGLIPNILNYGKLIVVVPTMIEPMILPYTPSPDKFFRKVNNAKRDYIHHRQQQRLKVLTASNLSEHQLQEARQTLGLT